MRFFPKTLLAAITGAVLMACCAGTQAKEPRSIIDPAFRPGLAILKKSAGIIEDQPGQSQADWKPDLKLLVGVKAREGSRQTIYFVELTTLRLPLTNNTGKSWSPLLKTNTFNYRIGTNTPAANKTVHCILALYPVRLRVFDKSGHILKEGRVMMPWGSGTNGLADMCRLSTMNASFLKKKPTNSTKGRSKPQADGDSRKHKVVDQFVHSMGNGFSWMFTLFNQLQTVPALKPVWKSASCAFRLPSLKTMAIALFKGFNIGLDPRLKEVTRMNHGPAKATGQWYRLPVDLTCGGRTLTSAEVVVGPASGAEMLLAGIRSIQAVHPAKPQDEFFAQVLISGRSKSDGPR